MAKPTLVFYIDSVPFSRPARNNYIFKKDRDFRNDLAYNATLEMKANNIKFFVSPIKVNIVIARNRKADSKQFGDIDNHLKNIFDALNGILWKDDSLIVQLHCQKRFTDDPYIKIVVEEVNICENALSAAKI